MKFMKYLFITKYFLLFTDYAVAWHIPCDLQADNNVVVSFLQL